MPKDPTVSDVMLDIRRFVMLTTMDANTRGSSLAPCTDSRAERKHDRKFLFRVREEGDLL